MWHTCLDRRVLLKFVIPQRRENVDIYMFKTSFIFQIHCTEANQSTLTHFNVVIKNLLSELLMSNLIFKMSKNYELYLHDDNFDCFNTSLMN